ncbi:MAG: sigma-70 family RNA polymerase sigma factor [Candidatus Omnitrophota bacterium]
MEFRILMERITPALRGVAHRYVLYGFYGEDDLFQEMCLYLWQHYGEGLPIGINESYVIKGCEFHLLNFLRKGRKSFKTVSLDEPVNENGLTLKETLASPQDASLYDMDARITIDNIRSRGLTKKENEVLTLLLKGHTVREIAGIMGISHVMVLKHKKNVVKKGRGGSYQE